MDDLTVTITPDHRTDLSVTTVGGGVVAVAWGGCAGSVAPPSAGRLIDLCRTFDGTLNAIYNLDPEGHATKSRDYGRGFAEALRVVRAEIDTRMGGWVASQRPGAPEPQESSSQPPLAEDAE